ncbi:MAG: RnfH family protein [Gammaproteobacteria bacterium]|nr:RnfH family protein [Gammaproteobacteria bacterium]
MRRSARFFTRWQTRWWHLLFSGHARSTVVEPQITVEVVYARPGEQALEQLHVPANATVEAVIRRSGLLERFPEIDLASNKVGIFGKASALAATLNDGDRIEIYRPLIADPKEARKKRAAEGKVMKKGAREQDTEE